MKYQPGLMKKQPETVKNHKNKPGTMNLTPQTMEKPTCNLEKP